MNWQGCDNKFNYLGYQDRSGFVFTHGTWVTQWSYFSHDLSGLQTLMLIFSETVFGKTTARLAIDANRLHFCVSPHTS